MYRIITAGVFTILLVAGNTRADDQSVTFRHTFEAGIDPVGALGDSTAQFLGAEENISFTNGISGQGFLTGKAGQALRFKAAGNIPAGQGTVLFWMRALPGEKWNVRDQKFYIFFELFGGGGWVRLYKYHQYAHTFLLSEKTIEGGKQHGRINLPNSAYREDTWNLFAFTWTANNRASFYINGVLVGQAENFPMPEITPTSYFQFGQAWGGGETENRIMDNLTVYNRVLSNYEIMRIYRTEGSFAFGQEATIGKTSTAVTIDGKIESSEWEKATAIPIAIENTAVRVADTISYLRLMYDDKNLFLAFQSPIPEAALADPHGKLLYGFFKRDVLGHDENVDHDDALDINIIRPTEGGTDFYRMVVNTIDTAYDYVIRADRTIDLQWAPAWEVKSEVGEFGWTFEARIPFAGLETAMPKNGDVWQVNFHRIWKQLKDQKDSWTLGRRDPETAELQRYAAANIVFGGDETVAVNNLSLENLHRMMPEVSFELHNHSERQRNLHIEIATEKDVLATKRLALTAKERQPFAWNQDLTELFPAELSIRIVDLDSDTKIYSQQLPLFAERLVDVRVRSYPSSATIKIEGDISALDIPAAELTAKVSVMKGTSVETELSFVPDSAFFQKEIDVSALASGEYTVVVHFLQEENELVSRELPWTKYPLPDWYGNSLGISDEVPEPWIPLSLSSDKGMIKCWGREYEYDNRLFLSQVTTAEQQLLLRPANFMLLAGGAEIDLNSLDVQTVFTERSDSKISWESEAVTDQVNVAVNSFIEFDGMLWTEVTLAPRQQRAEIESLIITLPLRPEAATLINPYDYSLRTTGYLPEKGWSGNVRPLWIGNEAGGLQFFAETSYNWQVPSRQREIEVIPAGETVLLKINLITKPFVLDKEETFAFGLQATPVKPMHPDHRKWRIGHPQHINPYMAEKDIEFIAAWSTSWGKITKTSGEVYYPIPRENLAKRNFSGEVYGRKWSAFPYYQLHETWAESDEFKQFGDEWLKDVKKVYLPRGDVLLKNRQITVCQAARSHQDFILYGYDLLQKQANPRGYYYDMSQPGACNNVYHGCGYQDDFGQYHSTYNILGSRELVKRIYMHLKEHRPDGMILYHNSGQIIMPVHGFADLLLDGENTYSRLDRRDNRGYEHFLTLDTYRAEYMGHNFGPAVGLLPQFTRAGSIRREEAEEVGPQHAEYVLGLILLHDSQLWITYFYDNEPLRVMYKALAEHDFATGGYDFVPYWEQKITAEMPENDAVASFYVDSDSNKALMVLMNMSGEDRSFSIPLDTAKLGFIPSTAVNACHQEEVATRGAALQIENIPSHTYRLLVLE